MNQVLLCAVCDKDHKAVIEELGADAKERDCVADWLSGQQLRDDRATCFCWETDPFPIEDFPQVLPNERRFHHYRTIAKLLGANGKKKRAKLPPCVAKRITEMYPDEQGAPTKVGYQQDAAE